MTFFGIAGLFSLSLLIGLAVMAGARRFNLGADSAPGVQRFHTHWVPRLGGVPIFVAFSLWAVVSDKGDGWLWVACLFPAFAAGLLEDLTHKVGSWPRLLVTMCGAAVAWFVLGAQIHRLALPVVDGWLSTLPFVSLAFTAFAVAGGAHALNIIDGYNGLASSFVMVALFAIMIVAGRVQDFELVYLSGGAIAATLGFFVINFPSGRMFLGDGGAYTLGTMLGLLLVVLVARHPEVSPWFALTLLAYPVWETLFSIYRKKFLRGTSPMEPDGIHLHMLFYKRLVRSNRKGAAEAKRLMNSATTLYSLVLSAASAAMALTFWSNTPALYASAGLFAAGYVVLYFSLVRFRAPRHVSLRHAWDRSAIRVPRSFGMRASRSKRGPAFEQLVARVDSSSAQDFVE